jgi:uncharacterized membrane protein YfcA
MIDFAYWLHFWWMFPVALLICITVNIIGVSGSVLFLPFYAFIFPLFAYHLTPIQIVQLGLFTETFGFASSTLAFWRQNLIDFQIARFSLVFVLPMSVLGAYLANRLPGSSLLLVVGIALFLLATFLLKQPQFRSNSFFSSSHGTLTEHYDRQQRSYQYIQYTDALCVLVSLVGGFFQGIVGFGSGELSSIVQILRKTPVRIATGTAHLVIFGASLAASCTHMVILSQEQGPILWNILVMTIPAVLIGGQIAGLIAGRLPQAVLRMIMARFLIFIGFLSIYRALAAMNIYPPLWLLVVACTLFILSVIFYLVRNKFFPALPAHGEEPAAIPDRL